MDEALLKFYSRLYRCEDCREIRNPDGVLHFIEGRGTPSSATYLPPTVPVSHFGDVANSRLWIVTTNPKGDRQDPLVGLDVLRFGVARRSHLRDSDIEAIFNAQCGYFRENRSWHSFFLDFAHLLDGIQFGRHDISFRSGDVCFVDAIKCPTAVVWGSFVRSDEGKQVWNNCLRIKNRFLQGQIEMHEPRAILYFGTGALVKVEYKGNRVNESSEFSNRLRLHTRHLYEKDRLERISIEFSKAKLDLPESEIEVVRDYVSSAFGELTD